MRILSIAAALVCTSSLWAAASTTYYHTDVLGSPVMATDAQGAVIWDALYSPYGTKLQSVESRMASFSNPVWFTGHVQDPPSNLVYMQGRHYSPLFGRFMSVDPAGFSASNPSSFNRYAYAQNNPYKYVDPNGEEAFEVNLFIVGFTLGNDVRSAQPFYKFRIGAVGVGASYDPNATFGHVDIGVGKYEGFNQQARTSGLKGRIGISLGAGSFSADASLVETQRTTVEIVDSEGESTFSTIVGSSYLTLGDSQLSTAGVIGDERVGDDSDKIGLQMRADLFYEFGETF